MTVAVVVAEEGAGAERAGGGLVEEAVADPETH